MFSKILVKLIDQSIIPAILLLTTRIISIVLVGKYFDIKFKLGASGFEYSSRKDFVLVNSYSIFIMIIVLAIGLFYILLKSFIFHESHISPRLTAKVFSLRISSFIQNSFDLYSQGAIWLSYLYLLMLVCGVMVLFSFLYPWVFYVAVALCIVSTALLILDVENEISFSKTNKNESPEDDFILNFGDDYE